VTPPGHFSMWTWSCPWLSSRPSWPNLRELPSEVQPLPGRGLAADRRRRVSG
jgi:hypothetical protein